MGKLPVVPFEPTHDIYHYTGNPLDKIFAPKSVALIGATEKHGTVGRTILWNLISSPFGGTIYPINPNRPSVLGIKAYPNIAAVPEQVDLAVFCTPATSIPGLIKECVDAGVPGAIIAAGASITIPCCWRWPPSPWRLTPHGRPIDRYCP